MHFLLFKVVAAMIDNRLLFCNAETGNAPKNASWV